MRLILSCYEHSGDIHKECSRTDELVGRSWREKTSKFNSQMKSGFDNRAKSKSYQKILESEIGVRMTSEDKAFWHDNSAVHTKPRAPVLYHVQRQRI